MVTLSSTLQRIEMKTGYKRFKFINTREIIDAVITLALPDFTHFFPYKTYYKIDPVADAVDPESFPGIFRIMLKDAPPEKIYDTGMVFNSHDVSLGGYGKNIGRSAYDPISSALYAQMQANLRSMIPQQQTTGEYIQPNFIQLWPKRRRYDGTIIIELLLYHADDLHTIPNAYEMFFIQMCVLHTKAYIYEKYKDLEDEVVGGHQVRTKISSFQDAEDKLETLYEKLSEESFFNPDRLDTSFII